MKSKIKPNRYKTEATGKSSRQRTINIDFCLRWIMLVAGISVLSLASIFTYDLVTQSSLFAVKQVTINGNEQIKADEIISFAGLDQEQNLFKLNIGMLEKKISLHPWVASANIKRRLSSILEIEIVEQKALAIVKIENIADIIINTQGRPFKEYDPEKDRLEDLPVVTGLDLTHAGSAFIFEGDLFNAVMTFLNIAATHPPVLIKADDQMGITIDSNDIYNRALPGQKKFIRIKMGFGDYHSKFKRAKTISEYIGRHFPDHTIIAMDLFNPDKVFVKTARNDSGHNALEKGV